MNYHYLRLARLTRRMWNALPAWQHAINIAGLDPKHEQFLIKKAGFVYRAGLPVASYRAQVSVMIFEYLKSSTKEPVEYAC